MSQYRRNLAGWDITAITQSFGGWWGFCGATLPALTSHAGCRPTAWRIASIVPLVLLVRGTARLAPAVVRISSSDWWSCAIERFSRLSLVAARALFVGRIPKSSGVNVSVASKAREQLQVFQSVVQFVAVDVMHDLFACQRSAKMLLHDVTMLKDFLAAEVQHAIATARDCATVISGVAGPSMGLHGTIVTTEFAAVTVVGWRKLLAALLADLSFWSSSSATPRLHSTSAAAKLPTLVECPKLVAALLTGEGSH